MEGSAGAVLETGAKVVESVAQVATGATEVVAQTAGGATNIGTSLVEKGAPIIGEAAQSTANLATPLIESTGSVTPAVETLDIGSQLSQTATELVGAERSYTAALKNGDTIGQTLDQTRAASVRSQLDDLIRQREIDQLETPDTGEDEPEKRVSWKRAIVAGVAAATIDGLSEADNVDELDEKYKEEKN